MNPDKKWKRYTRVGDIYINMAKYKERLEPSDDGCLIYNGPRHRQGYSMIGVLNEAGERKMTVGHRVAMRMKLGREIDTNEDVRHACSNLACVNPAHLYIRNDEERNEPTTREVSVFAK